MKVLLVEDDLNLVDALSQVLASRGFDLVCCADGMEALAIVRRRQFDVVLLDLTLPGIDGLDWLQRIRDESRKVPVLVMTARAAVEDRVTGLNCGADDYLTKPFDIEELTARLKALVRRTQGTDEIRCGALRLERATGLIYRGAVPLDIGGREMTLLRGLIKCAGKVVAKDAVYDMIFGDEKPVSIEAIDVLVHRLRKRIQGSGVSLVTLRGIGYFVMDESTDKADLA